MSDLPRRKPKVNLYRSPDSDLVAENAALKARVAELTLDTVALANLKQRREEAVRWGDQRDKAAIAAEQKVRDLEARLAEFESCSEGYRKRAEEWKRQLDAADIRATALQERIDRMLLLDVARDGMVDRLREVVKSLEDNHTEDCTSFDDYKGDDDCDCALGKAMEKLKTSDVEGDRV